MATPTLDGPNKNEAQATVRRAKLDKQISDERALMPTGTKVICLSCDVWQCDDGFLHNLFGTRADPAYVRSGSVQPEWRWAMDEMAELTRAYEHEKFAQAKERMEDITAFYVHLAAFVTAMLVMLHADVFDGDKLIGPLDWVFWPFLGWGIGLLGHAWAVYGNTPRVIADWQERKIRKLMADM